MHSHMNTQTRRKFVLDERLRAVGNEANVSQCLNVGIKVF